MRPTFQVPKFQTSDVLVFPSWSGFFQPKREFFFGGIGGCCEARKNLDPAKKKIQQTHETNQTPTLVRMECCSTFVARTIERLRIFLDPKVVASRFFFPAILAAPSAGLRSI